MGRATSQNDAAVVVTEDPENWGSRQTSFAEGLSAMMIDGAHGRAACHESQVARQCSQWWAARFSVGPSVKMPSCFQTEQTDQQWQQQRRGRAGARVGALLVTLNCPAFSQDFFPFFFESSIALGDFSSAFHVLYCLGRATLSIGWAGGGNGGQR